MWRNSMSVNPTNSINPNRFPSAGPSTCPSSSITSTNSARNTKDGMPVNLPTSSNYSGANAKSSRRVPRPEVWDWPNPFPASEPTERPWVWMLKRPGWGGPRCHTKGAFTGKSEATPPKLPRTCLWRWEDQWSFLRWWLIRLTTWISWDLEWCER